jgi:lipopolysaccharide assembly protein A
MRLPMRWIYLAVIVLFVAAVIIFAMQNLTAVTMSFLGFSVRAPLAILAIVVYVIGAITGGSVFALLRKSVRASRSLRETTA